ADRGCMTFILANACILTMSDAGDILDRGSVLVRGDPIAGIGTTSQLAATAPATASRQKRASVTAIGKHGLGKLLVGRRFPTRRSSSCLTQASSTLTSAGRHGVARFASYHRTRAADAG